MAHYEDLSINEDGTRRVYGLDGQPLYYVTLDDDIICAACATREERESGIGLFPRINLVASALYCASCGNFIECTPESWT